MNDKHDWLIGYDGKVHDAGFQYVVQEGSLTFGPFPGVMEAAQWAEARAKSLDADAMIPVGAHFTIHAMRFPGKHL